MDIANEQWKVIAPLVIPITSTTKRGRPIVNDVRSILNGILWILRTGAPWKDIPDRYPPRQTCHRWFQKWRKFGVFDKMLLRFATDLRDRGKLDLREAFIDGTFAHAKKRGLAVGKTKRGKGIKIMAVADDTGTPISAYVASASPRGIALVEATLLSCFIDELPDN